LIRTQRGFLADAADCLANRALIATPKRNPANHPGRTARIKGADHNLQSVSDCGGLSPNDEIHAIDWGTVLHSRPIIDVIR
jgi:hypothetical protein